MSKSLKLFLDYSTQKADFKFFLEIKISIKIGLSRVLKNRKNKSAENTGLNA